MLARPGPRQTGYSRLTRYRLGDLPFSKVYKMIRTLLAEDGSDILVYTWIKIGKIRLMKAALT
jgi:hypothetical protein